MFWEDDKKAAIVSMLVEHMNYTHNKIKNKPAYEKDLILTHAINGCKRLILEEVEEESYDEIIKACNLNSVDGRHGWTGILNGELLIYADKLCSEYDDMFNFLKESGLCSNVWDMDFILSVYEEELKLRVFKDCGPLVYYDVCKAIGFTMYV